MSSSACCRNKVKQNSTKNINIYFFSFLYSFSKIFLIFVNLKSFYDKPILLWTLQSAYIFLQFIAYSYMYSWNATKTQLHGFEPWFTIGLTRDILLSRMQTMMNPSKYLCSTSLYVKHLRAHHRVMNKFSGHAGSLVATTGQQHGLGNVSYST